MRGKSLKYRIFFLFMLLAGALSFFSLYFLHNKYNESLDASTQALSAKIQVALSGLIHQLQIERGLSSGHLFVQKNNQNSTNLSLKRTETDRTLQRIYRYMLLSTQAKTKLNKMLKQYNMPYVMRFDHAIAKLTEIRQSVDARTITFEHLIGYYRSLINELLDMYFSLVWMTRSQLALGNDIIRMEWIKEYAGLERAYIYHQLLKKKYTLKNISKTRQLIEKQTKEKQAFFLKLTPENQKRFQKTVPLKLIREVGKMRRDFFTFHLDASDAEVWFATSTARIDAMERFIDDTIQEYLMQKTHQANTAKRAFYVLFALGLISFLAFLLLVYYLNRLLRREEKMIEDLRIASYAFDAQEAMVVTDNLGTILRVNKAFTAITGYSANEAKGQNPSILKSGRHSNEFYEKMWRDLAQYGLWRGEIYNKRKNGEIYPEHLSVSAIKNDEGIITHYISHFVDITNIKQAEAEARHQASHDFLTQLPNRKSMIEKLNEEIARSHRHGFVSALMFIDLDDFKRLNDTNGHTAGDKLLIEVAQRLKANVREEDFVARISGDEFCVILVEIAEEYEAAAEVTSSIAEKLLTALSKPYAIDSISASIGASIGIRLFPESGEDADEIIRQADASMYKAKEAGKNRFVFFDEKIQQRIHELMHFQQEMHRAIDMGEIVFYFQPKVSFKHQDIVGAELMVRWEHPERGLLFPGDFLEVFENMSLMPKLSEMALEAACQYIGEIPMFDGALSVNITAYEMRSLHFVQKVETIIQRFGIDPKRIELEILENDLIEDFDAVIGNMNRLRAFGVRFSIDDFGVGYSSINYLSKLPVDTLKIDRKFVLNLQDNRTRETIRVITRFSRVYEIKTVIEGIETQEELDLLSKLGLDYYQGFYFSRAVSRDAFTEMIREKNEG
jgi:diguanylate cyclase (GGDEF)-like protein/PAS domain S-box-containing protein